MGKTVKARKHFGADSLDLTIPVEITRQYKINEGDIFKIEIVNEEKIVLKYERIYISRK